MSKFIVEDGVDLFENLYSDNEALNVLDHALQAAEALIVAAASLQWQEFIFDEDQDKDAKALMLSAQRAQRTAYDALDALREYADALNAFDDDDAI